MREQHLKAAQLWAAEEFNAIQLKDSHYEEIFCVLSQEWETHFKNQAARESARFSALEMELENLLARIRHIKKTLTDGPRALNARYGALMADPPQGVFEFRGSLHLLPASGHTLMVGPNGLPIWETLRKATGEELKEAKALEEKQRQLAMFPASEGATPPAPAKDTDPDTATLTGDTDEMPF